MCATLNLNESLILPESSMLHKVVVNYVKHLLVSLVNTTHCAVVQIAKLRGKWYSFGVLYLQQG